MRTTGGFASAATSTRSRSSSAANHLASSIDLMPIWPPSGATSRTCLARIRSLTRGSLVEIGILLVCSFQFRSCHQKRQPATRCCLIREPERTGCSDLPQRKPGLVARWEAGASAWSVVGAGSIRGRRRVANVTATSAPAPPRPQLRPLPLPCCPHPEPTEPEHALAHAS